MIDIDTNIHFLGKLCKKLHGFLESGQSLRYIKDKKCVECIKLKVKNYEVKNQDLIKNRNSEYRFKNKTKIQQRNLEYRKNNIELCKDRSAKYYQQNKDALVKKSKDYRDKNKQAIQKRSAEYRLGHKEIICQQSSEYYQKNREEIIAYQKEYYSKNSCLIKIRQLNYRAKNPHLFLSYRASEKGRLARKIGKQKRRILSRSNHKVVFTYSQLKTHFELFNNCCAYCEKLGEPLTIDHFTPVSQSGAHCLGNIVPACMKCNNSKRAFDPKKWFERQPFYSKTRWNKILKILGKTDYRQMPLF